MSVRTVVVGLALLALGAAACGESGGPAIPGTGTSSSSSGDPPPTAPAEVATGATVFALGLDVANVYLIGRDPTDARLPLLRQPRAGGATTEVFRALEINDFAVNNAGTYIARSNAVIAVPHGGTGDFFSQEGGTVRDIVANESWVYWSVDDRVKRRAVSAGSVENVATGLAIPAGLAMGGSVVVVACAGDGSIQSIPLAGTATPTVLASARAPLAVAVDDVNAYFTEQRGGGPVSVWAVPLSGGAPVEIASGGPASAGGALAVDGTFAWFSGEGSIRRVERSGGAARAMFTTPTVARVIVVDNTYVTWVDGTGRVLTAPR